MGWKMRIQRGRSDESKTDTAQFKTYLSKADLLPCPVTILIDNPLTGIEASICISQVSHFSAL